MSDEQARAVGPLDAILKAFTHCFDWRGRASRSEFWWYYAFYFLTVWFLPPITYLFIGVFGDNEYYDYFNPTYPGEKYFLPHLVFYWVLTIPVLFLIIRRLRDSGRSAWWAVLGFWSLALASCSAFMDTTFGIIIWFTYSPYTFATISGALFYFGCLALCAMPTNSGTSTWSPDRIPITVGLLAARIVIGFAIYELVFKFISVPITLEIDDSITGQLTLSGRMMFVLLVSIAKESTLLLALLVVILSAYKFEGRNIYELFKPDRTTENKL